MPDKHQSPMNPNEVETRLREIAERENKATNGPWELLHASVIDPEYTDGWIVNRDGCGSLFVQEAQDSEFIAHSRQDVPWLLALIKKQREALEADALADKLFERAEAHREESIACGYDNDPTGSLAVTESYKAANAQALIATQLKKDALNFSPGNL